MTTRNACVLAGLLMLPFAGCVSESNDTPDVNVQVERDRKPDVNVNTPGVDVHVDRQEGALPNVKVNAN